MKNETQINYTNKISSLVKNYNKIIWLILKCDMIRNFFTKNF